MTTQPDILIKLAAWVWFTGVIVLFFKSTGMVYEAVTLGAPLERAALAVVVGITLGWIKAKHLFVGICRKNLDRIRALESPKIWQFYRSRFFFFLFCMILFGRYAYTAIGDDAGLLLALAVLELSVSTALLISGRCFFTYGRILNKGEHRRTTD